MAHQPYPAFSAECFGDLIRVVRGGTVREELPLFAKCVYTLAGAALGATVGEPAGPLAGAAPDAEQSVEELRECLASLSALKEDGHGVYGADEAAIDPATLSLLIQLAVQLISAWINRK